MSYQIINTAPSNSSDAYFRLWGKGISDALQALGVTKTADTGQIDWATVATPALTNTYQGYEIRQFTDGIQATNPILVKIEYGSSGAGAGYPCLRITVAHTSDGAGTLTGDVSAIFYCAAGSGNTTAYQSFISSDGGRLNLGLWITLTGYQCIFWIERFKDSDGTPNADGVNICSMNHTNSRTSLQSYAQTLPASGAAFPATPTRWGCAIPATTPTTYNENLGLFPIYPHQGYAGNPDLGGLVFNSGELSTAGSFMTVNIYGANHVYVLCTAAFYVNSNSTSNVMVRCE
jgi:hypothetical protein